MQMHTYDIERVMIGHDSAINSDEYGSSKENVD